MINKNPLEDLNEMEMKFALELSIGVSELIRKLRGKYLGKIDQGFLDEGIVVGLEQAAKRHPGAYTEQHLDGLKNVLKGM